jgi:fructosamine-3-kinase
MLMLPQEVHITIEDTLSKKIGKEVILHHQERVFGGDISESFCLTTSLGKYFLKLNSLSYLDNFEKESRNLQLLEKTDIFVIPEVIVVGTTGRYAFLLMEYIESIDENEQFWTNFGEALAKLHSVSSKKYGLDNDNYIGGLKQSNQQRDNWVDFFIQERLEKQLVLGKENGIIDTRLYSKFQDLYQKLPSLLPTEKPALLHGDMWGGNHFADIDSRPVLIDPACYYGHREAELAFTLLFTRFSPKFYEAYHSNFPLADDWRERVDIYNLYNLLVHANLFGPSYLSRVQSTLKKYI